MPDDIKKAILEISSLTELDFIKQNIENLEIKTNICNEIEVKSINLKFSIISNNGKFIVQISTENHKNDIDETFRNLKDAKNYCLAYLLNI